MNLNVERVKPCKKTRHVTTVGLSGAFQEDQPIVISQVKCTEQQGRDVFIVVKRNGGKSVRAEVKITAPPEGDAACVEGVRRDVKNIMNVK